MKNQDHLAEYWTVRQNYMGELHDAINFYVSEMAALRRIKETTQDDDIRDAITGIIMDELTIIEGYRRELL